MLSFKHKCDYYGNLPRERSSGPVELRSDWVHFRFLTEDSSTEGLLAAEIRDWIIDNGAMNWALYSTGKTSRYVDVHFENKEDAMRFKLTWL
jgi:hypothetical protein